MFRSLPSCVGNTEVGKIKSTIFLMREESQAPSKRLPIILSLDEQSIIERKRRRQKRGFDLGH